MLYCKKVGTISLVVVLHAGITALIAATMALYYHLTVAWCVFDLRLPLNMLCFPLVAAFLLGITLGAAWTVNKALTLSLKLQATLCNEDASMKIMGVLLAIDLIGVLILSCVLF